MQQLEIAHISTVKQQTTNYKHQTTKTKFKTWTFLFPISKVLLLCAQQIAFLLTHVAAFFR